MNIHISSTEVLKMAKQPSSEILGVSTFDKFRIENCQDPRTNVSRSDWKKKML